MTPAVISLIAITMTGTAFFVLCNARFMSRLARSLQTYRCDWYADPGTRHTEGPRACEIHTGQNGTLHGTFFKTHLSDRRGVVLFAHESGGDRWSVMPYLDLWRRAGYDILACDFDGCREHDGVQKEIPNPWITRSQVNDVLAGIDFLCADTNCEQVVLMGVSRGGLAALCAAAVDDRVVAVVADSCYACEDLIVHYIRRYAGNYSRIAPPLLSLVPNAILRWHARLAVGRLLDRRGADYPNPFRLFPLILQPVLLIHGSADDCVPSHVAKSLAERMPNSGLWIVDGGRHMTSVEVSGAEYEKRVSDWVTQCGTE